MIAVHILTNNDSSEEYEIGTEESGLYFESSDAVEITSTVSDTFDVLQAHEATITLQADEFVPDLYCANPTDAVVNILRDGECVFAGYIAPRTYNQDYMELGDAMEINCTDLLGVLEYITYKGITTSEAYAELLQDADERTFADILTEMLCPSVDIVNGGTVNILYDGTKAASADADAMDLFSSMSIDELLFLGEEQDDLWTCDTIVEAMLKYLNLHAVQIGFSIYLFDWESVKQGGTINFKSINGGSDETKGGDIVTLSMDTAAPGGSTSVSIGEVYNVISMTCNVTDCDTLVENPLDSDDIYSPYPKRQIYMAEFSTTASVGMLCSLATNFAEGKYAKSDGVNGVTTTWYMQVMRHPDWSFGSWVDDMEASGNATQESEPRWLSVDTNSAGFVSLGSVEYDTEEAWDDDTPVSTLDMTNYLVVTVNGNGEDDDDTASPTEDELYDGYPCATYTGNVGGGVLSPADDDTTNYIVISGKLLLAPLVDVSCDYADIKDGYTSTVSASKVDYADGTRYYAREFLTETGEWNTFETGLIPPVADVEQLYQYNYNEDSSTYDDVGKVDVLACMLIVGDKCVVEDRDVEWGGYNMDNPFSWQTYKTMDECEDEDEYWAQSFTIGINPAIGDYLIGQEYDFASNIVYTMGIDASGMAIPVKKSDNIHGKVQFMILGPVNSQWNNVTRRHGTWFRKEKWTDECISLLAHVQNIWISDFEIKVYSDNGLLTEGSNDDIVYTSDTDEAYLNKKDDIDMRISSALTSEECQALGVTNSVKLSTPSIDGEAMSSVYDVMQELTAKPEQFYVDAYYNEYHVPRVQMSHEMDDGGLADEFLQYVHPALGKTMIVQSISRNLSSGKATVELKSID